MLDTKQVIAEPPINVSVRMSKRLGAEIKLVCRRTTPLLVRLISAIATRVGRFPKSKFQYSTNKFLRTYHAQEF